MGQELDLLIERADALLQLRQTECDEYRRVLDHRGSRLRWATHRTWSWLRQDFGASKRRRGSRILHQLTQHVEELRQTSAQITRAYAGSNLESQEQLLRAVRRSSALITHVEYLLRVGQLEYSVTSDNDPRERIAHAHWSRKPLDVYREPTGVARVRLFVSIADRRPTYAQTVFWMSLATSLYNFVVLSLWALSSRNEDGSRTLAGATTVAEVVAPGADGLAKLKLLIGALEILSPSSVASRIFSFEQDAVVAVLILLPLATLALLYRNYDASIASELRRGSWWGALFVGAHSLVIAFVISTGLELTNVGFASLILLGLIPAALWLVSFWVTVATGGPALLVRQVPHWFIREWEMTCPGFSGHQSWGDDPPGKEFVKCLDASMRRQGDPVVLRTPRRTT